MDRALWETSGHWQNYRANMFLTKTEDDRDFALKPMNCPGHMLIYGQGTKSYRDLPLKLAEFGKVHRYEPSGALHGLLRVRSFTQDDAHIYCTPEQLTEECLKVNDLVLSIYRDFGFEDVRIKLSTRPENRIGSEESWDRSEEALRAALDAAGHAYTIFEGEGAFYGPKLEYVLRDAIGRDWQCGTLQVDFNLPERFGTTYVAPSGEKLAPVMLHRALFGSLERFTGILIEHHAGHLPLWLAPVQVVVATITGAADLWAVDVAETLREAGLRVETDLRNEKIGYKVREHALKKVPVQIALGTREAEDQTVTIRRHGQDGTQTLPLAEAVDVLVADARSPGSHDGCRVCPHAFDLPDLPRRARGRARRYPGRGAAGRGRLRRGTARLSRAAARRALHEPVQAVLRRVAHRARRLHLSLRRSRSRGPGPCPSDPRSDPALHRCARGVSAPRRPT